MNKVMINGRLIREPETQEMDNGNFRCVVFIANDVYQGQNKETGFYRVNAWGKVGRVVAEHCRTGTEIFVTGRLEYRAYEGRDGSTVHDVGIVMEQFDFGARSSP